VVDQKILITGAGGFIGSHLTELCIKSGYTVRVFLHYNSRNHWGWLEDSSILKDVEVVTGDVRDFDSVYAAMKGCRVVYHLAALIAIPYSYISPLAFIRTNIEGTYNILEAAKNLDLQQIIVTSTSETYGTAQYVPIDEKHPIVGQSPYSASKIAADQIAESYFRSFELPVKIVRPFNTYGPRQSARAIIPTIIMQILAGEKVLKLGSLYPTRDFTYVEDTAKGFIAISKNNSFIGEITNIGSGQEISIKDLIIQVAQIAGKDIKTESDQERIRPERSEVLRLLCDNKKLLAATDWHPSFSFSEGLTKTYEWIKENLNQYKSEIYNL
jgi:NAD dependent epimerase/dehydratase